MRAILSSAAAAVFSRIARTSSALGSLNRKLSSPASVLLSPSWLPLRLPGQQGQAPMSSPQSRFDELSDKWEKLRGRRCDLLERAGFQEASAAEVYYFPVPVGAAL